MRAKWTIGAILATTAILQAEDRNLVVYVQNSEYLGLLNTTFAENAASRILAEAGVRVQWKTGQPHTAERGTLTVVFDYYAPARFDAGALAYARPFAEGAAIHVFYRRVAAIGPKPLLPVILGHVLAHEIGHVLRGDDYHQDSGVMKAHWTSADFHAMAVKPYSFGPADISQIHDYWPVRVAGATR